MEPVNPQPLPLRARPRKRRREDGRNEPGGESRRRRVSGDRGSQPRPDVQEGRPAAAAKLTPEAQARGQRAEHQPARPSAVLAKPGVQPGAESVARRVVAPCVGARSDSDEPGEARTVTPPAARFLRTFRAARQRREVSRDLDTDGLSLVVLSSGVQEGRPAFARSAAESEGCRDVVPLRDEGGPP